MKYFSILTIIATALAAQSFTIAPIRSGSRFQYSGISSDSRNLFVGGNAGNVDLVLNDDGTLYNRATDNFVNVGNNNRLMESDYGWSRFKIQDGNLVGQNGQRFYACPTNRRGDRDNWDDWNRNDRDDWNRNDRDDRRYRDDRMNRGDRDDRRNRRNQYTLGLNACNGGSQINLRLDNVRNVDNRYQNDRRPNDNRRHQDD